MKQVADRNVSKSDNVTTPPAVPALSRGDVIRAYFSVTITSLSRQAAGVQGGS